VDRGDNMGNTARIRNLKGLIFIKTNINPFKKFPIRNIRNTMLYGNLKGNIGEDEKMSR
jgi:hypothetical protein